MQQEKTPKVICAYETLKQDILHIKIAPATPLKINWLRDTYNFGSTPLREALSRLVGEHLVILHPNKGYFAAPVSFEEMINLYNNRTLFKQNLLKEAMIFGDTNWEAEIVATHYRLGQIISPSKGNCSYEEYIAWTKAHDAFDNALIAAHRSPWMIRFHLLLTEHIRRQGRALRLLMPNSDRQAFLTGTLQSPTLRELYALERYTDLKDAVISRNFDQTEILVNKHIDLVIATYRELHIKNNN